MYYKLLKYNQHLLYHINQHGNIGEFDTFQETKCQNWLTTK